jgi:transposase, IS5 family
MQRSFAEVDGFRVQEKVTRRAAFLSEMDRIVPRDRLEGVIRAVYPSGKRGRQPYPLEVMLRVYFVQQWYGYSDPGMEEALHDIPVLRRFVGLDAGESRMPDETTILNFRHLLEAHQLAEGLFQEVVALLTEQGLILREGTMVDATLISAPPSTKNRKRRRDPQMSSSKKGNQWHFGLKCHIGVDAAHGLVHTVEVTTGKVSDYSMSEVLLHGAETMVHADRGYADKKRELGYVRDEDEVGPQWYVPFMRRKGAGLTDEQRRINRLLSSIRSVVEHSFQVIKRRFGYQKVRYRGLFKNEQHLFGLFALANLYRARHLMAHRA